MKRKIVILCENDLVFLISLNKISPDQFRIKDSLPRINNFEKKKSHSAIFPKTEGKIVSSRSSWRREKGSQTVVIWAPISLVFVAGVAPSLLWRLSQSCLNILSLVHTIQLFCYMAQRIFSNWSFFASKCVHRSRILNWLYFASKCVQRSRILDWLYFASICVHRSRILNVRSRNNERKKLNLLRRQVTFDRTSEGLMILSKYQREIELPKQLYSLTTNIYTKHENVTFLFHRFHRFVFLFLCCNV